MRRIAGQAARHTGRALHFLIEATVVAVVVIAAAAGLLAWRLSQGPVDVSWAAPMLERAVNSDRPDLRVHIGSAALAWEGFRAGVDRPLDIRLTGLSVTGGSGPPLLEVPSAAVSLSLSRLVLGQVVPRGVELDGLRVALRRSNDRAVALDFDKASSTAAPPSAAAQPETRPGPTQSDITRILHEPSDPAAPRAGDRLGRWEELRRVRVHDAAVTMDDPTLGVVWQAPHIDVDMNRGSAGGLTAQVDATIILGDQSAHLAISANAQAGGKTDLRATITPLVPARLAALATSLAPLAALDAPVAMKLSSSLDPDFAPVSVTVEAEIGAGIAHVADGTMPIVSVAATAQVNGALTEATLDLVRLQTAPRPDGPVTTFKGKAQLRRDTGAAEATAGQVHVAIQANVDQASFADLPALWPMGMGGPGSRPWITKNITDGVARNGHVEVRLTLPGDLSDATVVSMGGGLDGHDLTVHWLRPVEPIEHAEAHLTFTDPDTIDIAVQSGRLAGPRPSIEARNGSVHLTGIAAHDQFADIDVELIAPVANAVALLKEPRIGLLDRRPVPMTNPSGQLVGKLGVTKLPLRDAVSMDDVKIHTDLHGTDIHLGGIAAGRDLDYGTFELKANNDGMTVRGNADVAHIPAQLAVDMDFRAGPPNQVLEKIDASARLTDKDYAALGLDAAKLIAGAADLHLTLHARRDDRSDIAVQANLGGAALAIPQVSWTKPAGDPAVVEAQVQLDHDRIASIDRFTATGKGIDIAANAEFASGKPRTLHLDRFVLGDSIDAQGEVGLPQRDGDPWEVTLRGSRLDVSGEFSHHSDQKPSPPQASQDAGTPWAADVRIDRVTLGPGREMTEVVATGESDGQIIRRATLSGRTSAQAVFRLDITPQPGGRRLSGSTDDAGGLLRAMDVMDDMQGGKLVLSGVYDDRRSDHRLTGTATMDNFRVRNAPALAKLLQAMTLYGLVDAVSGPGLGFTHLIAPFTLAGDTLGLGQARTFNPSLGMTATGHIDLARREAEITGTIVPAYFFNSLLGRIPFIGSIFSPEKGGGVFAADYWIRGKLSNPSIGVNPLAAITPGFLRGLFNVFD